MKAYQTYVPHMRLIGSPYFPLQACDVDVLCPQCGGYGTLDVQVRCHICEGRGNVPFTDPRIVPVGEALEAP